MKQLESSGDLRAACRGLSKVGRLATGAVDPLWRALEQRRGIAGKDASKDRAAIMEALATIGGDRLVSMPNAVDVIKESYVADREHDHDGAAVRVMAAMGDAAFLDLVSDKNALADIINGMGPAAWTHLPAVLAKRDGDFWWRIMNRVGPPPAPAILELVRIARDGGSAQPLIEPLKDAAAHGMTARAREQVIPLMREQISGGDGRSASLAYDALLKLLSGAEHEALVLEGIRGTQFRRHAILAIQGAEGALSTEPVMSALSGLLADPGTDLWCRMRIRETLNHPAAEIAQESLEHLLTATTFESSDVYEVARAFGDRMHLATLARLLDAESPGVRLKAAEIMVRRVEHKPVVADAIEPLIKLFTVVDADAELAAVREYPYEKVRGALDEAKA
ncbi:MAG TPA: hypothetical protein VLC93_09935 [Myxococcota bacterium]|nr:hypothetical protein [Myxococcota bacterium]